MNLSLNNEQMQTVIAGAVLQMLTPENRESLIREAVVSLMTPKKDSWSSSAKSPLQEAFDYAVSNLARQTVRDMLAEDAAFKDQLRAMIAKALEKAFEKSDDISTRLANTLGEFFAKAAAE